MSFGPFGSDSNSTAIDETNAAAGASSGVVKGAGALATGQGFSQGQNASFVSAGAGEVKGGYGSNLIGQNAVNVAGYGQYKKNEAGVYDLSNLKNSTVSITQSDPEVLKSALAKVSELAQLQSATLSEYLKQYNENFDEYLSKQTETASAAAQSQSGLVEKFLGKVSELAESKQTEGESGRNKTVLYVVLGLFLAAAAVLIFRRR